jgi:carbonic anhydrase
MQFAVEVLGVRDIIVYGHYGCGGVKAAFENNANGLIENWLANIKDVIRHHKAELEQYSRRK